MDNIAAIILAAGRGSRMQSATSNKVMSELHGAPIIQYPIQRLRKAQIKTVILVVGFAKESIESKISSNNVIYAYQDKQEGTAHALSCGLHKVPIGIEHIISMYGDDSYLYTSKLFTELVETHKQTNADVTLLTVKLKNPAGFGRIVRDKNNNTIEIVEDKIATDQQKAITEVNTGLFVFKRSFIEEYLPKVSKNSVSGEYYLTDIIKLAIDDNKIVNIVCKEDMQWRGINTLEELEEAKSIPNQNQI